MANIHGSLWGPRDNEYKTSTQTQTLPLTGSTVIGCMSCRQAAKTPMTALSMAGPLGQKIGNVGNTCCDGALKQVLMPQLTPPCGTRNATLKPDIMLCYWSLPTIAHLHCTCSILLTVSLLSTVPSKTTKTTATRGMQKLGPPQRVFA